MSSSSEPDEVLNSVFVSRTKIGHYYSIPESKRAILLKFFNENAYPKKEELEELSQALGLSKFRIQNWFKYQRQKDFKIIQSPLLFILHISIIHYHFFNRQRKFGREAKKILEAYFRKDSNLDEKTLKRLTKILKCDKIQVERWFYYRNKKLAKILNEKNKEAEQIKLMEKEKEKMKQLQSIFEYNERIGKKLFNPNPLPSPIPMMNYFYEYNKYLKLCEAKINYSNFSPHLFSTQFQTIKREVENNK